VTAIAAPAAPAAPSSTPSTPAAPKNGATHTEVDQPPATDPKPNAKAPVNNEPGAKPGETAAQTRQRLKVKLRKLDGPGEEELELDEADVGRYVQKARVADKTRAADEKAKAEWMAERDAALKDPLRYFKERSVDLVELGKQAAAQEAELAKLDPVQRELAEARQKLERFEAEKQAAAQRAEADAKAAEMRQFVLAEQNLYKQAIAVSGRNAKTPAEAGYLMKLYADVREMAEHAGVPLTAEQLAAAGDKLELSRFQSMTKRLAGDQGWRVKHMPELKALAEAITQGMDDAGLLDFFGPKTGARLARAQLSAYRKSPLPTVADMQPPPGEVQQTPPQRRPEQEQSLMGMLDKYS
jgi:uncharacterized membrane protein YqiK